MRATVVVVAFEIIEFFSQVARIPERHVIQILTPDGANNPLDERVGHWDVRNRLDFIHFQYSQVGLPTMRFVMPSTSPLCMPNPIMRRLRLEKTHRG